MDQGHAAVSCVSCVCRLVSLAAAAAASSSSTAALFAAVSALFFWFRLAHRRPHALQRVFAPSGPLRHSGLSVLPQVTQTYCGAAVPFFPLFPAVTLSSELPAAAPALSFLDFFLRGWISPWFPSVSSGSRARVRLPLLGTV